MNDFLENLAERAMNAEQGVRPRLPSLFDPALPAVTRPAMESAAREPFETTTEREAEIAGDMKDARPTQPDERPFRFRHQALPSVPPDIPSRARASVVNDRAHDLSLVEDHVESDSPIPAMMSQPTPSPLANRRDPAGEERRPIVNKPMILPSASAANEHRDVGIQPVERGRRRDAEAGLAQDSLLIAPRPRTRPVSEADGPRIEIGAIVTPKTEAPNSFVVHPRLDRYVEPVASQWRPKIHPPSSPSPEPVINVTIGRIEVRATPPPPATTRSSNQKPPVMSLDDYLRQRSGGGGGGV